MNQINKHSEELIQQVRKFRDLKKLTLDALGKMFGYSSTTMSKWMDGKFMGDLGRLEKIIFDGLRAYEKREREAADSFETHAVIQIRQLAYKLIKKSYMGAAYGDAGLGKTVGANKLLLADLSAIFITACVYRRDKNSLIKMIWDECGRGTRGRNRIDYIEEVLKGSGRLLIVDQAHLLNKMGRQFFCDLHDRLRIPIMLIGNPEMFEEWRQSEQQYTRLKLEEHITLKPTVCDYQTGHTPERAALDLMVKHGLSDAAIEDLKERAFEVVRGKGYLRALDTTLTLLKDHMESNRGATWIEAFDAGESQQVRNFRAHK